MRKVFKAIAVISMVLVLSILALAKQSFNWTFRNDPKARAFALLAKVAQRFRNTSCIIQCYGTRANVKNTMKCMGMGMSKGKEVEVIAEGPQEKECIQAVKAFFEEKF